MTNMITLMMLMSAFPMSSPSGPTVTSEMNAMRHMAHVECEVHVTPATAVNVNECVQFMMSHPRLFYHIINGDRPSSRS